MVNPIGRNYSNNFYKTEGEKGKTARRKAEEVEKGVIVNISRAADTEEYLEEKTQRIKKLIKEGKYPLDRDRLAERILQFLTDVG